MSKERNMKLEQELRVMFIGYSAFLIIPSERDEFNALAKIDFVTGRLYVPAFEQNGFLYICEIDQLKPFLLQLQTATSELQDAVKDATEQQVRVRRFEVCVDVTTGQIIVSAGENALVLPRGHELGPVIEELLRRTRNLEGVLRQIDEVGRKFERTPYEDHIDQISSVEGRFVTVQLQGLGIVRSGRLELLPWPSSR
jgi:hypothetical protein